MNFTPSNDSTTSRSHELVSRSANSREDSSSDSDHDDTCCGRATWCNPYIRDINVTRPVSPCVEWITWSSLFWLANSVILVVLLGTTLYFLAGDDMAPGGRLFGLYFLVVFAYALGWSLTYIPYLNLPPVFGMLLAGIAVRYSGWYNIHEEIGDGTTRKIRTFCLTFVMLRAGLQLSTTALREHPLFVAVLAFLPGTLEVALIALCSRYILRYPWNWSFLNGTVIACMSPVVTFNCMLALADRGYGEDKGIATLLCTASSLDGVHVVWLFSVCYSFVFSIDKHRNEWWSYIPGGIRDLLLGILVGIVLGLIFTFVPNRKNKYAMWYRICCLVLGSLMCSSAASKLAITGGGYLAIVIMSFIATTGWRLLAVSFDVIPFRKAGFFLWHFMQPVLVGVIGAEIDFDNWTVVRSGLHLLCLIIGLLGRSFAVILSTLKTPFTMKESLFFAISWLPKGTLQAALAPMAFEQARKNVTSTEFAYAIDFIEMSVLSIVILAPLGAVLMMITGPLLLNKISEEEDQRRRELSYLRILSLQPVRMRKSLLKRRSEAITEETA